MGTPADELVDLVDERDQLMGTATLGECTSKGLLHRAVAVQIVRPGGKLVLQRRSRSDKWHPGLLTISSTGHVKSGESYEAAAARELKEELGIEAPLVPEREYLLPKFESNGLAEREWVSFFTAETSSPLTIDPVEVDSTEEVTPERLEELLYGETLTPDAVIILGDYLRRRGLHTHSSV